MYFESHSIGAVFGSSVGFSGLGFQKFIGHLGVIFLRDVEIWGYLLENYCTFLLITIEILELWLLIIPIKQLQLLKTSN